MYTWMKVDRGYVLTKEMHILGGINDLPNQRFMYWVNIADEIEISLGALSTWTGAKRALLKFLVIDDVRVE